MNGFADKKRAAVDAAMHEEVFKTSVRIIEENGLNALTLDRIAREVGVSRPTLYNYFPDRAGVLIYVEDRVFGTLEQQLELIAASDASSRQRLKDVASTVIGALSEERALLMAFFHQELIEGSALKAKAERRERAVAMITAIIEDGIRSGEFRTLPVQLAAEVYFDVISGLVDRLVYYGKQDSETLDVPQMMEILFAGFNGENQAES